MIDIQHITVRSRGAAQPALRDLSLCLPPGITLVQGPNGAGKSTLLQVLATLVEPVAGRVQYPWTSGLAATLHPELVRGRIGYVPQQQRAPVGLTAVAALRYLAATRGVPHAGKCAAELLATWGLHEVARRPVERLSIGQARRWLLAQSRILDPLLWLLDEPTAGLDLLGLHTLRRTLAAYRRRAAAPEHPVRYAVVVTHDDRLGDLADRAVHLRAGRVIAVDEAGRKP